MSRRRGPGRRSRNSKRWRCGQRRAITCLRRRRSLPVAAKRLTVGNILWSEPRSPRDLEHRCGFLSRLKFGRDPNVLWIQILGMQGNRRSWCVRRIRIGKEAHGGVKISRLIVFRLLSPILVVGGDTHERGWKVRFITQVSLRSQGVSALERRPHLGVRKESREQR